ncbi:MAG: hypothetical protein KG075_09560 [Alphaproteobacteria bacterium]|nr:hypothetical protein [Alphaproteobacteria bacterium]
MSATQEINDLRAAGFTDAEIGEWAVGKRKELSEAGFAEGEIDEWFGAEKPAKASPGLIERLKQGNALGRVLAAAQEGASNAFGSEQIGFSPDSEKWLRDAGIFADPETGRAGPIRFLNEAMLRPAAVGLDAVARAFEAGLGGFSAAAGQIATEAGSDQGKALERDLNMMGQIAGIELGKAPFTRVQRLPTGEVQDVVVAHGLPTKTDFEGAAVTVALKADKNVKAKLERLYEERGLHPAEVAHDALADPVLLQELLADNMEMPARYRGQPKKVEVPEPQATVALAEGSLDAAKQKVLEKISVGDSDPRKKITFQDVYTQMIDDLNPIKELEKSVDKTLPASESPYQITRLSRGTFGKADQMLEYGTYDFNTYATNGKGLRQVLDPVRDDLNGLRAYAAASRAVELEGRGIKSGLDLDAAKQVMAGGKNRYEPVMRELVEYQDRVAAYLRDSGVLSKEAYDAMREANKNYVPFFRVMDDGAGGPGVGSGVRNPIKAIKGSERDIVDPLESVIKNTYVYTAVAERNAIGKAFVDMAAKSGRMDDLAKKIDAPVKATTVTDGEMAAFLKAHGIDKMPEDLLTVFRAARQPLRDNQIAVFQNGKRSVYELDPDVATALKNVDAQTASLMTKILAFPAQTLRAGAVLSPDFIVRNVTRDFLTAFVNSKGVFTPLDTLKGAKSLLTKDADFQNWLKSGGANSALVSVDRQYLQNSIQSLTAETGLGTRAWNVVKSPVDGLRVVSELMENATRLGEFKKVADGVVDKATLQQAGMASREVTLDFARIGASMRAYNMITAFGNASIQGIDRTVRQFGEKPLGTTARVAAGVTLPSVLLWWANHDDPRWKEIPRWQKDLFWIVMTEDHVFRIPKPFELGLVFGSATERALDAWFEENPNAFKDFDRSMLQAFLPSTLPTIAQPIVEQFANRSSFTGAPLIPQRLEKLLPEYQYTEYTTETTKALGALVGAFPGVKDRAVSDRDSPLGSVARALTTPILMENYLRAWTGGLGMYALQIADKGLREAGAVPDPVKPAATLADIPVVKAFVVRYPSASAQSIQDFYDRFEAKKTVWSTVMAKAKDGDAVAAEQAAGYMPSALVQLDGIQDALSQHGQIIRLISNNPEIPAGEKRQLIDTLYFRMIEIAQSGNAALDQAEKTLGK